MATINGLDKLNRKLRRLEDFHRVMREPVEESAALMTDYISKAPRKKAGAFSAMATPGQRRAYWARVRAKEIDHGPHGYKRTSTMARGWNYRVKRYGNGLRAEIGNQKASAYGYYVQSAQYQQPFHKASGWRTDEETIKETADEVQKKFDRVIKRELNR